jgi:hypothetical protein
MGRIGILVIVSIWVLGCSHAQICKRNAECMIVDADCCGCHHGGKQKAISVYDYESWKAHQDSVCVEKMCTQVISQDPSCSMSNAICMNGKCVLNGTNSNP